MRLSFWEQQSFFNNIDVAVIGSGIVGLNAAWHLKTLAPSLNVVVLERGFLPYGASTRNAGFACFGSMSELLDDLTRESENEVFARVEKRYKGLLRLREKLGDNNIGYEPYSGFEVFTITNKQLYDQCLNAFSYLNSNIGSIVGNEEVYSPADNHIADFNFNNVEHLICNKHEGQIDTGKMMLTLLEKTRQSGVTVFNGINISQFNDDGKSIELTGEQGLKINARKILICNNGFAKHLLPDAEVTPARAQVLITSPINNLKLKGSFHYDKGYYYFRNVGNRILLGGGRNLDFAGEETYDMSLTTQIQNSLEELLLTTIAPYAGYSIEQRWSGIMGLGKSKTTIVKKLNTNTYCAVRMGGMGIAIGSVIGEDAAQLLVNDL